MPESTIPALMRQEAAELVAAWDACQDDANGNDDEHDIAAAMAEALRGIANYLWIADEEDDA